MSRRPRVTRVVRAWDWALPPSGIHREVLSCVPDGWHDRPRSERKPSLLFVHGLSHAAWCWQENFLPAAAERGYPAHAVSLRGHGGSGGHKSLRRSMTRDYVHDVMQSITELPEPPVLVGHSMGTLIAHLVAERYPVRGLALLTPLSLSGSARALAVRATNAPTSAAAALVGMTLPMSKEDLFPGLDEATADDYVSRLGRESPLVQYELLRPRRLGPINAPVLVIGTPEDRLVPRADVAAVADFHGVEPVWLPGMGHDLMLDRGWEKALDVLLGWADGV